MLTLEEFKNIVNLSKQEIYREIYAENASGIKVKKEERVVKNLAIIFDTTLQISNKKGFHAMSLRDLSIGSGLSMGALYSYFGSKEQLLNMIQEQGRRLILRIISEQVVKAASPTEKLQMGIATHLYLSEALQPWFYFSYMEAKNLDKNQQKEAILSELATEQLFADILREGQNQKIFSNKDADMTAAIIKAILQDWYLKRWKYVSRGVSVEHYAQFVIDWTQSFIMLQPDADSPETHQA